MTQLKSKSGVKVFDAVIEATGVTLHKEGDKTVAKKDGVEVGIVRVAKVKVKGKEVSVSTLIPEIDVAALIGKDPTTLTHEESIALVMHLQSGAKAQVAPAVEDDEDEEEEVKPTSKKSSAKPATKPASTKGKKQPEPEEDEDDEDEEEDGFELPAKYDTYEKIAALGVKAMWAEIGKHIAAEAGIKARTPKDEMLEAIAEHFELEPEEEEAPKAKSKAASSKKKSSKAVEEDEDDEDDEDFEEDDEDEDDLDEDDEDEDDFDEDDEDEDLDDEDDEDDEDFDEDEDDEDDEEDEDEDDEDDEEFEVTEEDVDNLFKLGDKGAIVKFCRDHDITLPKRKLNAQTLKKIIKDALFGEEE